jgi:hypothetical protein
MLFAPEKAWEKIALRVPSVIGILVLYLLPLLALTCAGEAYALQRWGDIRGEFDQRAVVSQPQALRYAGAYAGLGLLVIFSGAKLLQFASRSFEIEAAFAPCFTILAYASNPIFLSRLLDGVPSLDTWFCWAVGGLLAMRLVYHGIGIVLKPPVSKGLGLFLLGCVMFLPVSAVAHFLAVSFLRGKLG